MKLTEIMQQNIVTEWGETKVLGILFDNAQRRYLLETESGVLNVYKITAKKEVLYLTAEPKQETPQQSTLPEQDEKPQTVEGADGKELTIYPISTGMKIYDYNGKYLGEVTDATLTGRGKVKNIITDSTELPFGKIAAVGEIVTVKAKSARQKIKKSTAPADDKQDGGDLQTGAENKDTTSTETVVPQTVTTTNVRKGIRRRYGDFSFLIGKTVDKTLVNFQGEVMIKQHEVVTKDILKQAKISGKLTELYLHIV